MTVITDGGFHPGLPAALVYVHELEALPEQIPSLEETGFFISGFNWFTDNIATVLEERTSPVSTFSLTS